MIIAFISKEKKEYQPVVNSKIETQEVKVESKLDFEAKEIEKVKEVKKVKPKRLYKPISHMWFFVICVLFWFFVWFWLWEVVLHLHLLISFLASFILFIFFGILFKFKYLKVRETKIYMLSIFWLLVWSIIMFFHINLNFLSFDKKDEVTLDNFTWVEQNFVSIEDDDILQEDLDILLNEDLDKNATFADVIKYLIDKNQIKLVTTKNIAFTNIKSTNIDYDYYRTAYDKQLIGKSVNPSNNLLCETYVVMQWLLEWWEVYSYKDIKLAYWDYAKNNDILPTCEYGKYIKIWDLD